MGTVTSDGTQVVPDKEVQIYEFTGAMFSGSGTQSGSGPQVNGPKGGDPVDLASGYFVKSTTDLVVNDVMPIEITRTYRQGDVNQRSFGVGTTLNYEMFLSEPGGDNYTSVNLILPDGEQVPYTRTSPGSDFGSAVFSHVGSPSAWYNSTITYNGDGWNLVRNDGMTFVFGDHLPLQYIQDRFGNKITLTYTNGYISQITSPSGRSITLNRDNNNNIKQATDDEGRYVKYTYQTNSFLTSEGIYQVTDNDNNTTTYNWTNTASSPGSTPASTVAVGSIVDARGNTALTINYDVNGRVSKELFADGATYQFVYTLDATCVALITAASPGCITQTAIIDPLGFHRDIVFSANGYSSKDIWAHSGPSGLTATSSPRTYVSTIDPTSGFTLSMTDPLGHVTSYCYDTTSYNYQTPCPVAGVAPTGPGNLTAVTRQAFTSGSLSNTAVTKSFTYSTAYNQLTSYQNELGNSWTIAVNALGESTSVTDPLGNTIQLFYTSQGQVNKIIDPLTHTASIQYNLGLPQKMTNPLGNVATIWWDAVGRLVRITDPLGQSTQLGYDPVFGTNKVTDPNGNYTSSTYDAVGNVASVVDPRTNATSFSYDCNNRTIKTTDPLNHSTTASASSSVTVPSTCASGGLGSYDGHDNLLGVIDRNHAASGQQAVYTWDDFGEPLTAAYPDGSSTSFTWDGDGNLTQVVDSVGGTITRTYDTLNRLHNETTPQGSITYSYDNADRLYERIFHGADNVNNTHAYHWYNNNWLQNVQSITSSSTSSVAFNYNGDGTVSSMSLPNGILGCYTYDLAAEPTGISYYPGGTCASPTTPAVGTLTYAYDADGRVTSRGGSLFSSPAPTTVTSASYNADNQLTQWTTASSSVTPSYDLNGNMVCDNYSSSTSSCTAKSYTWDSRNRMRTITGGSSFGYDGFGRRTSTTLAGTTKAYLYDGMNAVEELESNTTHAVMLNGPGLDNHLGRSVNGAWSYGLNDALGSTMALTPATGTAASTTYAYDPTGNTTSAGAATDNPYQYTGRENDGTGLYYYRARSYNPSWGRFTSADPIGFGGGDGDMYRYVWGSPTNFRDPLGLWGAGLAAGLGAEAGAPGVGSAYTSASAGAGVFFNQNYNDYTTGGGYVTESHGANWGQPCSVFGLSIAHFGISGFITNAPSARSLEGLSNSLNINTLFGSVQISWSSDSINGTTWSVSAGPGADLGTSVSSYATSTSTAVVDPH
jgi:RHS repeat-associated protein